jgi:hypothetical protein
VERERIEAMECAVRQALASCSAILECADAREVLLRTVTADAHQYLDAVQREIAKIRVRTLGEG